MTSNDELIDGLFNDLGIPMPDMDTSILKDNNDSLEDIIEDISKNVRQSPITPVRIRLFERPEIPNDKKKEMVIKIHKFIDNQKDTKKVNDILKAVGLRRNDITISTKSHQLIQLVDQIDIYSNKITIDTYFDSGYMLITTFIEAVSSKIASDKINLCIQQTIVKNERLKYIIREELSNYKFTSLLSSDVPMSFTMKLLLALIIPFTTSILTNYNIDNPLINVSISGVNKILDDKIGNFKKAKEIKNTSTFHNNERPSYVKKDVNLSSIEINDAPGDEAF